MKDIELWHGDCLDMLKGVPRKSVRLAFCDLPYGITRSDWDQPVNIEELWAELKRPCIDEAAFVFTATQPFASDLIHAQRDMFAYDLIWQKEQGSSGFTAKSRPIRTHEHILVFGKKMLYYPQMRPGASYQKPDTGQARSDFFKSCHGTGRRTYHAERFPVSVLPFTGVWRKTLSHPTQKPEALLNWIIATFTNPGDLVLDPTAGSGTTAAACVDLGRRCIAIEKDKSYYDIMVDRVSKAMATPRQEDLL